MSEFRAEPVKLMLASFGAFTQPKETVGELFSVVREYGSDTQRTGAFKIAQKAARVGRRFAVVDADKDPAGGPINRNEQITAGGLVGHLWRGISRRCGYIPARKP